nr:hypothetical protein CFP56_17520 [Quercus suber]
MILLLSCITSDLKQDLLFRRLFFLTFIADVLGKRSLLHSETEATIVPRRSSSQPSNLVHSLSYQHPLYYHWQAPFLNPQMEELNLIMESFLQTKSQCIISFYSF